MSAESFPGHSPWRAVRARAMTCFEWIGFAAAVAALGADAERAGRMKRLTDGGGRSLHYAPDRWLICDPAPAILADLQRASGADAGVLTDVSGKWLPIRIAGAARGSPLTAGFAVELVLKDRDCAALWLFDCPVLVCKDGSDLEIWLEASYEASFLATLETLGIVIERCARASGPV